MRFGILLILLQSMLLCAEGRAESQLAQLDSSDKVVRVLLLNSGQQQQDETDDPVAVAQTQPQMVSASVAVPVSNPVAIPSSAARAAHSIRGPPARH